MSPVATTIVIVAALILLILLLDWPRDRRRAVKLEAKSGKRRPTTNQRSKQK